MPAQVSYSEAFQFAQYCFVTDEFLKEYGSAIRWHDSLIDFGELFGFVDRIIRGQ